MSHKAKIAVGAGALLAMSSAALLADSSGFAAMETSGNLHFVQSRPRGGSAYDERNAKSYDYNVPLALPPYGYSPSYDITRNMGSLVNPARALSRRGPYAERTTLILTETASNSRGLAS